MRGVRFIALNMIGEDCNVIVAGMNFIPLFLSILLLLCGIRLGHIASTSSQCDTFLQTPSIVFAIVLFAVSLAAVFGGFRRLNWLLALYLVGTLLLVVGLLCCVALAYAVATTGDGGWLQNRVESAENWNRMKSCLSDAKLCRVFDRENRSLSAQILAQNLSPIFKSGCCKPPESCNLIYKSSIGWTKNSTANVSNPDCNAWNNDLNTLCYGCQSCKAAVVQDIKDDWNSLASGYTFLIIGLILFWSVGWSAFHFNRRVVKVHSSLQIRPSN